MDPIISKGIIQCISKLRENHELEDFKVRVDGDIYSCHKCIIAGCSEFFAGLLRSDMNERNEIKVELNNISSPIFQIIINSLYNGCDMLTKENVLEVWSAVHQLQIQFLIENCENFLMSNLSLDLLEAYKQQLNFEELMKIIQSDQLKVSSEDEVLLAIFDWVNFGNINTMNSDAIKATTNEYNAAFENNVLDKVSNGNMAEPNEHNISSKVNCNIITEENITPLLNQEKPNERKKFLIELIKSSRYCLASGSFILRLYKNKLIQSDILVKEILFEALNFKVSDNVHGHWSTPAIHRDCSDVEHLGVWSTPAIHRDCSDVEHVGVFSILWTFVAVPLKIDKETKPIKIDKVMSLHSIPNQLNVQLTILKEKLYACSIGSAPKEIYVLQTDMWVQVAEISQTVQLLLTHEKFIYMFDVLAKQITRFNPDISPMQFETFDHEIESSAYALSLHNTIVVFSSVDKNGVEETAVHSWNTTTQVWTKLDNLSFSSKNMTSFRGDRDTYILDCNCNLWKVTNTEIIEFTLMSRIWSKSSNIIGAQLFRETLFLYGDFDENDDKDDNRPCEIQGVFSSVMSVGVSTATFSNVVHYVIPKKELKPLHSSVTCNTVYEM